MQEYEDWTVEPIPDTLDKAYQKALGKVNKCLPLEDALVCVPTLFYVIVLIVPF